MTAFSSETQNGELNDIALFVQLSQKRLLSSF